MANSKGLAVAAEERKLTSSAEALLDAASGLLAERGAMDVSLSDIAKRSGLNAALIKYYFGNKDGLLLAILERDAGQAMGALQQVLSMGVPAEEKLRIHINGIINAYFRSPYLNRLIHYMVERGGEMASSRVVEIYINPMIAAYRSIVEQGISEGRFRSVDPMLLYFSLVGACDHIFYSSYSMLPVFGTEKMGEDLKRQYVHHVTEVFMRGLVV